MKSRLRKFIRRLMVSEEDIVTWLLYITQGACIVALALLWLLYKTLGIEHT